MTYNYAECKKGITLDDDHKIKLVRDSVWEEYQVRIYVKGKVQDEKTYHTDDRLDAVYTMNRIVDDVLKAIAYKMFVD